MKGFNLKYAKAFVDKSLNLAKKKKITFYKTELKQSYFIKILLVTYNEIS